MRVRDKMKIYTATGTVTVPEGTDLITPRAAAKILKCSMGHVRHLRRLKTLKSWKTGERATLLDMSTVQEYAAKTSPVGAPRAGFSPDT
jgi:excisionase family DNA binding protein